MHMHDAPADCKPMEQFGLCNSARATEPHLTRLPIDAVRQYSTEQHPMLIAATKYYLLMPGKHLLGRLSKSNRTSP